MNAQFFRTIHDLESANCISSIMLLGLAVCVIGAWIGWLFLARVTVYQASHEARLALVNGGARIDAPVSGRIVATHFSLGDRVHAGDTLVELDAQVETRQLDEAKTALAALAPRLSAVIAEIKAEQQGMAAAEQMGQVALRATRVRWQGAENAWKTANEIAKRYKRARHVVSEVELLMKESEAEARRTEADDLRLEMQRLPSELQTQKNNKLARIQELEEQQKGLEGEEETTQATIKRLDYETERHSIRAPVSGSIVEIAGLGIGSFVPQGGRLGTIAPPRQLKAIADFSSSEALGHILPGQRAWLRLNGFPWTQYGTISGTVKSISSEPHDGLVRVDLMINPQSATRIPIREGLLGSAEVEVEHTSPATLILRAAGTLIAKPDRWLGAAKPVVTEHDTELQ